MYYEYNCKTDDQSYGSALRPRFSQNKKQSSFSNKGTGYKHIRIKSGIFDDDKVIISPQRFSEKYCEKNISKPAKQRIRSYNLEQNNVILQQYNNQPKLTKRPISSFQPPFYQNDQYISPGAHFKKDKRLIAFDQGHSMQKFCLKMAKSIILSSDTIDSMTQVPEPLCNNSFERIKFLGQGKFGQVHLVKHKTTGFLCALKIIDKNVVRQENVQSQIIKQLKIQSQLKCFNIIQLYGFFDDERYFYILLQYATEGSVFSKLKGRTRLQEDEIQPIAKGVCDGLRFIHKMGFVHRDIKPQNIVLQFGVPKICDFGWSTYCDQLQMCKSYCGTPLYISPEMIRQELYGTSVDIWAVGLVVYELIVGRGPFRIWNQQDMNQILTKPIQFPQYIDRSRSCQSFIRKCLQKQTFNRIQVNQALRHPFLNQPPKIDFDYYFIQEAKKVINNLD